jgi:cytochrome P450
MNPARWRLKRNIDRARTIIEPLMEQHKEAVRRRAAGEEVEEEDSLLNWMMDNGTAQETEVMDMVIRQCFLTIASIHTTSMALTNLIFDLTANPESFQPLSEEIEEVERVMGKLGTVDGIGCKEYLPKLEKLDSAFVESQRFSPPILCESAFPSEILAEGPTSCTYQ